VPALAAMRIYQRVVRPRLSRTSFLGRHFRRAAETANANHPQTSDE
jgi:hypothetical protein